ncbi:unnamed protein product [Heterosigma akashiwo]
MAKLTLGFHRSTPLPGGSLSNPEYLDLAPSTTVAELARQVEVLLDNKYGIQASVSLMLNPSVEVAIPFHETATKYFQDGDAAVALGDFRRKKGGAAAATPMEVDEAAPAADVPPAAAKVPVTILTGFLGAGKTTVLNYLLQEQRDRRIAVIENEFGEVPIDNELLAEKLTAAEQVVVMDNGCLCCTVRGDLLGAFTAVMEQMDPARPLDAVVVETTGMADPVPIVRTFLQTPAVAARFRLDGVVTLADAVNVARPHPRPPQDDDEAGDAAEGTVNEAWQQVAFANRLILSKVDLVPAAQVVEVFHQLRAINPGAKILPVVRGRVDPAELSGFGAFDLSKIEDDLEPEPPAHEHSHSHGHGHGHGHEHCDHEAHCDGKEAEDCGHDHSHGHEHGNGEECGEGCRDHGHAHAHGAASKHNKEVGSFSLVLEGREVDLLKFARWVRRLSQADPKEQGALYRCKAVLAVAGSPRKLVFHAVSDVTEKMEAGEWRAHEARGCKIVFIGKRLDRAWYEDPFLECLSPVRPRLRAPEAAAAAAAAAGLVGLARRDPSALFHALGFLTTREVGRVARAHPELADTICGARPLVPAPRAGAAAAAAAPAGWHRHRQYYDGHAAHLHALCPLPLVRSYLEAARAARPKLWPAGGLGFRSPAEVEAAGVTWLELAGLADGTTQSHAVEFKWKPETLAQFFSQGNTTSAIARFNYEYEDEYGDEIDDNIKMRVELMAKVLEGEGEGGPGAGAGGGVQQYHLALHIIGGKAPSQVYQLSLHSIDPTYQVHVKVEDHRMPYIETENIFHKWHPLVTALKAEPRLRFLVRVKPDGTGPLGDMCGCC